MFKNISLILKAMRIGWRVGSGTYDYATQKDGFFRKKKSIMECILDKKNDPVEMAKDLFKK